MVGLETSAADAWFIRVATVASCRMDFHGYRHYRLNILLLCIAGLWPYKNNRLKSIQSAVVFATFVYGFIVQVIPLISGTYTMDNYIKFVPGLAITMVYTIKYIIWNLNSASLRNWIEEMKKDWDMVRDNEETRILKEYSDKGKRYMKYLTFTSYIFIFVTTIITPILSHILNNMMHGNSSVAYKPPFAMNFLIDEKKYYCLIVFYVWLLGFMGITVIISTEFLFVVIILHMCGLYNVAIYRMTKVTWKNSLEASIPDKYTMIRNNVAESMKVYGLLLQLVFLWMVYLKRNFELHYFIMALLSILLFAGTMFRLVLAICTTNDYDEIILCGTIVCGLVIILFYTHYMAQQVINEDSKFFNTPYDMEWYDAPLPARKLLLFIMQGRAAPLQINLYGAVKPSMEGFFMYMKTSCSYFLALYSLLL